MLWMNRTKDEQRERSESEPRELLLYPAAICTGARAN